MKIRAFITVTLMLLSYTLVTAQQISESDVPQDVFVSFTYKYPDATITGWETSRGNFLARFTIGDQPGSAEFTANGKWLISRFTIAEKELPSPIVSYFKTHYKSRDFSLASSELVKEGSGDTYYYLVAKKSGINQPKPSELYFDLAGKLIKIVEPEENKFVGDSLDMVQENKNPQGNENNQQNNQVQENNQVQNTQEDSVSQPTKFNKKELPTPINNYLKANYPEHVIEEASFIKDPTLGEVYYLIMKQPGFKDKVELYFDINGVMVKKVDQGEIKQQQAQNDQQNNQQQNQQQNQANQNNQQNQTQVEKQPTQEELRKKAEGDPVPDAKVPAAAKTHFASKVKKPTEVEWYRVERDFVVRYVLSGRKAFSVYDEDGVWKETRNDLDPLTLNALILNYIKDNFRKYRSVKAEYVQTAPKYKSYEVQIVEKADKSNNPPVTKLFFDANGKYTGIEKPEVNEEQNDGNDPDADFEKYVDENSQSIEKGTGVNEKISEKELPTDAITYIKTNYKELFIKEARYLYDDDLEANVYYVIVKKDGVKYEIELYFNLAGKLVKKIDPTEKKFNDESGDDSDKYQSDDNNDEESETINPSDLPYGIKNYLKNNYPDFRVDQATYMSNDEFSNVYYLVLKKTGVKTIYKLWFDLNGQLVKTEKSES